MTKSKFKVKRGRPKAMPDEKRRALIVAQAEKLFVEKGFSGTSTGMIADRCHISKQTLYRLFPGKFELFAAVAESHRLSLLDLGDGHDDLPLDQTLSRMFMVELDQRSYEIRAAFLRAANIEFLQHPELRELLRSQCADKSQVELKAWLDRQCANGRLAITDTGAAAHMLMDTFIGGVVFEAIGGLGWETREARVAHFRLCIDVFLNGVRPGGRGA